MVHGGNGDGGGVHLGGVQHFADRAEGARAELLGDGLGASGVGVHDGDQFDGLAALVQFVVNASVVAAEGASADDSDCELASFWHARGDCLRYEVNSPRRHGDTEEMSLSG
jgi:hypothetical protein